MRWGIICLICLLAAMAGNASTLASKWIRIISPQVDIFTDSGEPTARAILNRYESLRRVFPESYLANSPSPLRVFVFSSASEFEKYRTIPGTDGFYQPDEEEDFIVLNEGTALKRVATHEYLHMVMRHASPLLPPWLSEGVSEFYSTISVGAAKLRIGDPIEPHLHLLATKLWLPAEDLQLGSAADGEIFYAESWALVHMLSLSPKFKQGLPEFVKLIIEGREQDEAFETAFEMPMQDALAALREYIKNPAAVTVAAPPLHEEKEYAAVPMTSIDSALALADLALHTSHPSLARSLFLRAAKENPQSPAAVAGLGSIALAENRKQDAQREFERAIAMGYRDADTYFQLAMLKHDDALLQKALTFDPNFAEAHFLLGVRATDSGNFQVAIEHLRHAVAIQPRRFTYYQALGYAQAKSGDRQGAAQSARRAAILASTAPEKEMAAVLTLLAGETPAVHEKKPDILTPPSWQNPKGDTRLEGTLTRVDCDSVPLRLILKPPGQTVELNVPHPSKLKSSTPSRQQSRPLSPVENSRGRSPWSTLPQPAKLLESSLNTLL